MFPRAAAVWLILALLAILNGTVRNFLIALIVENGVAHFISGITLCLLIFAASWIFIGWMHPVSTQQALELGFFWLLLTVLFEFGAGHYLFKKPWEKLLADYNIFKGRIWVLVLFTTLLAPFLTARLRGLFH